MLAHYQGGCVDHSATALLERSRKNPPPPYHRLIADCGQEEALEQIFLLMLMIGRSIRRHQTTLYHERLVSLQCVRLLWKPKRQRVIVVGTWANILPHCCAPHPSLTSLPYLPPPNPRRHRVYPSSAYRCIDPDMIEFASDSTQ